MYSSNSKLPSADFSSLPSIFQWCQKRKLMQKENSWEVNRCQGETRQTKNILLTYDLRFKLMKNKYNMHTLTHSYKGPKSEYCDCVFVLTHFFTWKLLYKNYRMKLFHLTKRGILSLSIHLRLQIHNRLIDLSVWSSGMWHTLTQLTYLKKKKKFSDSYL